MPKNYSLDLPMLFGIFILGILVGLLAYQNLFPPKLVERTYFEGQNGTITTISRPLSVTEIYTAKIPVLAVKNDDNSGIQSFVNVEIRSGRGRVLIDTNPFVEPDTQFSAETAVLVAQKITGMKLSDRDIILSFEANTSLVGGPSAGAAMAVATIAALKNKKVDSAIVMTGTIESDGTIGKVGGVLEKAQAAGEAGFKTMLVPQGESIIVYYERQINERKIGPFVLQEVNYVPKKLDLVQYAKEKWDMEIIEVADISSAAAYFGLEV